MVLDALSASGLRAIRFLKEIPNSKFVYANDLSSQAITLIKKNFELNGIDSSKAQCKIFEITMLIYEGIHMDANKLVAEFSDKLKKKEVPFQYHVIDIDPYGSAIPFLDSAISNAPDGSK